MKAFARRQGRSILIVAALCAALSGTANAAENDGKPSSGAMAADMLIGRPLMLVATAVGLTVYVASLPFSLAGGNAEEAGKALVVGPAKNTFVRCLGCKNAGYGGT